MKKIVTILICLLFMILSCSFVQASSYTDVRSDFWAKEAIDYLSDLGALNGYSDGSFRPNQEITRAEFSKIVVELLGNSATSSNNDVEFMDVSSLHWANEYIKKASGYLNCNNKNRFYPDSYLIRQDAAMAMVIIAGKQNEIFDIKTLDRFSDKKLISEEYQKYVALAVGYELMNGNANGTFNPSGSVTRAEMCQIIYNVYLKSRSVRPATSSTENEYVYYSGDIDVKFTSLKKVVADSDDDYGVVYVTPINRPYVSPEIHLDVKVEGGTVSDGGVYTIGLEEYIIATIENPSSTKNFIYYMFAYGENYKETMVLKEASSRAEIFIPEELVGKTIKLSIWGTSQKDGVGYMTQTEIMYFRYSPDLKHRGENYDEVQYSNIYDRKVDFYVMFNGDELNDRDVVEYAKLSQKIIIRARPVYDMQSINYRWDKEIKYNSIEGPTATIEFPESFTNGSTHKLTVTITDKEGRTYVPRIYRFVINAKLPKTETE